MVNRPEKVFCRTGKKVVKFKKLVG
jgi:hypothetical protein